MPKKKGTKKAAPTPGPITPERVRKIGKRLDEIRDDGAAQLAEALVRPRLQELLDRAQARLRDPIRFYQGMGTWLLTLEVGRGEFAGHRRRDRFRSAFSDLVDNDANRRLRARIPELAEFTGLVDACVDALGYEIGDMAPSAPPAGRGGGGDACDNGGPARATSSSTSG